MSDKQREALRLYNALALSDRLRLDIMLQPGDIQLLSNHTQLHTRSAFVDHPVTDLLTNTTFHLLQMVSLYGHRCADTPLRW